MITSGTKHSKLIGEHPTTSIFSKWLTHEDIPCDGNKKHRKLSEHEGSRQEAVEIISEWLIKHHVDDRTLLRQKKKRERILEKYGLDEYLNQQQLLPHAEKTMRGNCAEVILTEYLQASSKLSLLVYKLRYNPNVNQSIKGDDVLLFQLENLFEKVILGESKFRKVPSQAVVAEITDDFGKELKLPLSILFVANRLSENGEEELADALEDLNIEMRNGKVPVVNVGFLLSNHNTESNVERHLTSENPNFVMLSLGIENPEELIAVSFALANDKIKRIVQDEE